MIQRVMGRRRKVYTFSRLRRIFHDRRKSNCYSSVKHADVSANVDALKAGLDRFFDLTNNNTA